MRDTNTKHGRDVQTALAMSVASQSGDSYLWKVTHRWDMHKEKTKRKKIKYLTLLPTVVLNTNVETQEMSKKNRIQKSVVFGQQRPWGERNTSL